MRQVNLLIKRVIDLIGSTFGIILLTPLFIIISILIKLDSKGPIFFRQKRLGKDGHPFYILKFRTMVENAENIGDGLKIKTENDSRITKTGHFLRKTSLDELPQLFNVLEGEMSLVGPRPPVVYFPYNGFESYPEWAKERFIMKPGITGYAQIKLRTSKPWVERIKLDIIYCNKFNLLLDTYILIQTIVIVFNKDKIYLSEE